MAKFERRIEIKAPAATVWSILSNIRDWPQWFPDMDAISNISTVAAGGNFDFTDGNKRGTGSILRADAQELLSVVTKSGDNPVTHTFDLKKDKGFLGMGADDRTELEYVREWDPPGGALGDWVVGGNPFDLTEMNRTLDKIRDMAEGRAIGR
jgi:uncharacterized protein YndB with AHSA1/START domain